MNPFRIDGPAVVSFSGGRTSALMLHHMLEAWGGELPADVHVLFANTGKEREETLEFVRDCAEHWKVLVRWLEYRNDEQGWAEVDFASASRKGEPYSALILKRKYLPNPVTRFCTEELKIRVFRNWMKASGFEHWTNAVGLRFDEPGRVARMSANNRGERWDVACPLYDARITKADVEKFWGGQPFDLKLKPWEGNCDLCFLKGRAKRMRIMRDRPDLAEWWIQAEQTIRLAGGLTGRGDTFRSDVPSYATLLSQTQGQPELPFVGASPAESEDDLADCMCGGAE